VTNEKLSAIRHASDLQKQLGSSEEEKLLLRDLYEKSCAESRKLAEEIARYGARVTYGYEHMRVKL